MNKSIIIACSFIVLSVSSVNGRSYAYAPYSYVDARDNTRSGYYGYAAYPSIRLTDEPVEGKLIALAKQFKKSR